MARPPLDRSALADAVRPPWSEVMVVDTSSSTNSDLLATADTSPGGSVLVAEHQTAGRGRLDRSWITPARSALTLSVLLRPPAEPGTWSWLPLLAGVAACEALENATGIRNSLKWPNDVLAGEHDAKLGGILAQARGDVVVIGLGLNVSMTRDELPVPTATSVLLAGGTLDRTALLLALLDRLGAGYLRWADAAGDAAAAGIATRYRRRCSTIGRVVEVTDVSGTARRARATGVDAEGRLVLAEDDGQWSIAAGDVVHVRPVTR